MAPTALSNRFINIVAAAHSAVAVIDTGIDYLHPALGGCFGPQCKVAFGYDFVGDDFNQSNLNPMPDEDPLDNCSTSAHGTHVAGIVAANATEMTQTGFIPFQSFLGVAPQATLGGYRIFGCAGDTATTDVMTAAIYRAFDDKADIITMSVGGAGAYTESSDAIAAQRVSEKGVYITFSFGNDGSQGLQTGGNPSISSGAMAVASVDNLHAAQFYMITPNNERIFYLAGTAFGGWQSNVQSKIVVNNPPGTPNDGCRSPTLNVTGAVVLYAFNNGDECGSAVRCNLAAQAGATGCLIYNVGAIAGSSTIPSGSISMADGSKIIAIVTNNPSAIFTFTNSQGLAPISTGGTPSSFTSIGLTGDLLFKPQISGIGGYVYSTISSFAAENQRTSNAYATQSGTSMATPYVAGTLALYLAHIGNPGPETVSNGCQTNCRPSFEKVVNLFQSNAKPVNIYSTSLLASVAQQGAGLVNVFQAIQATTSISPSQLALNDTLRQDTSYTIEVFNLGNKTAVYNIGHSGAALATGLQKGSDQLLGQPIYSADYAIVDIQPTTIELDPGKSGMITLRFQAPCNANAALLPIFSGFINITNNVNDQVAHIPYAGVVGDYKNARILVRNSSSRIVTGILNSNNIYISNTQQENLNLSNGTRVILVTAWASRIVFVEAVSGENQVLPSLATSYGYISTQPRQAPAFYINLVRNTAISFRSYSQSYEITWLGLVSKFVSNGSSLWLETARLPNGQYKLRFSALKHFGNEKNAEDYDIYETPTFNLIGSSTTTVSSTSTPSSNATESSIATPISLNIRELLIFLNLAFLFY
ncbi:unnamed protein product [Rotaria sordida]|uniref:Peptidase S8/S53 domain-containing protein n=1 Tax=Rotaria sordida TaxID=392033 RepID=A0A814L8Z5_9BILA|nr:unnamed protein product [Rotaria sordida]